MNKAFGDEAVGPRLRIFEKTQSSEQGKMDMKIFDHKPAKTAFTLLAGALETCISLSAQGEPGRDPARFQPVSSAGGEVIAPPHGFSIHEANDFIGYVLRTIFKSKIG